MGDDEKQVVVSGIKSVIISESVHQKLKRHCVGKKLRIGPFIEMLILNHIDKKKADDKVDSVTFTTNEPVA